MIYKDFVFLIYEIIYRFDKVEVEYVLHISIF